MDIIEPTTNDRGGREPVSDPKALFERFVDESQGPLPDLDHGVHRQSAREAVEGVLMSRLSGLTLTVEHCGVDANGRPVFSINGGPAQHSFTSSELIEAFRGLVDADLDTPVWALMGNHRYPTTKES